MYALVTLALLVYCAVDVVSTPAEAVRTLPKPLWLLVVVLLPLVGSAAWLLAGRPPRGTPATPAEPARRAPDDDENFLRELRRRAEDQRRRARDPRDD
ncbi:MAG: PLDc N-terminal domain-containing protein [Mycobacteriales bacterium]